MRGSALLVGMVLLAWAVPAQAGSVSEKLDAFGVQKPEVRKPAPDFSLTGLSSERAELSDFRGQLVMLHFWATWCVPCRHEMPLLHALESKMKGKAFRIICVNVDRGDRQNVQSFIDEVTPHFHTLLDPEGRVRNQYAVRGLPTTYLIAPDGKFIGRIIGERKWDSPETVSLLNALLATGVE